MSTETAEKTLQFPTIDAGVRIGHVHLKVAEIPRALAFWRDALGFELGIISTCGKCHEDVTRTYFDTYHGKVSRLGYTKTAKCYDCHGAHDILPVDNPRSARRSATWALPPPIATGRWTPSTCWSNRTTTSCA